MNRDKIPLARLYRRLFSRFWPERLKAYDMMADDLERRGCRLFQLGPITPFAMDAKLLTGQMISIYMKKFMPMKLSAFVAKLEALYAFLLKPMRKETSPHHSAAKELLRDIYDEDDEVAPRQIEKFFATRLRPELSVLENIFRCYCAMMRKAYERSMAALAGAAGADDMTYAALA